MSGLSRDGTLRIPAGCEEPARIVLRTAEALLLKEFGEKKIDTGGCRAFFSPQEWAERGEEYGTSSALIVVHDGGALAPFFDWNRQQYVWIDAMIEALKEGGYIVEQCTCAYSAVYAINTCGHVTQTHTLKTWPTYFEQVRSGAKDFELRKDDRGFAVGDIVVLEEYEPVVKALTGNTIKKRIKYILRNAEQFGLKKGHCILGLSD